MKVEQPLNIEIANRTSRFGIYVNELEFPDLHTQLVHSFVKQTSLGDKHLLIRNTFRFVDSPVVFALKELLVILKLMAQFNRPQNRAYTPYAVDSLGDGSKNELTTVKGSYQNPAYENSELAHQYEDPFRLAETVLSSAGPRRKRNELYEPTELNKSEEQEHYNDVDLVGDSWLSRLILFLILVVSFVSLLLVVLIILGKVGPSCSCNEGTEQGKVFCSVRSSFSVCPLCFSSLIMREKFETFLEPLHSYKRSSLLTAYIEQVVALCQRLYGPLR